MPLPQVKVALFGWQQALTYQIITETIVDHEVSKVETAVTFRGVIQPLSPQKIALKPEGDRAWIWYQIHAEIGTILKPGDRIRDIAGIEYKVMAKNDYEKYGYIEYHIIEDYTP